MWRIFKKKETETSKITDRETVKDKQTEIVVTKTGEKEVLLSTKIQDVQLEGEKSTTLNRDISAPSEIATTSETSASETLNDRLKAIQDIVDKAHNKNNSISSSTALDEDLSKFEPFIKDKDVALDNIETTPETDVSEIDSNIVEKAFMGGDIEQYQDDIEIDVEVEPQNEVSQVVESNDAEINDDNTEEHAVKDEAVSLDDSGVIDDEVLEAKEEISEDVESIAKVIEQDSINTKIDDAGINKIFEYLTGSFKDKFLAGALYDVQAKKMIYQHRFEQSQLDVFTNLFEKINAASSRSGFPKLHNYYVLDLENDQTAFVLLFPDHHFVLIFDKSKIQVGYIISIIRPYITNEYNIAIS